MHRLKTYRIIIRVIRPSKRVRNNVCSLENPKSCLILKRVSVIVLTLPGPAFPKFIFVKFAAEYTSIPIPLKAVTAEIGRSVPRARS